MLVPSDGYFEELLFSLLTLRQLLLHQNKQAPKADFCFKLLISKYDWLLLNNSSCAISLI